MWRTEIGLHTHFVGEIMDVKVDSSMLTDEGEADIEKIRPIILSPEVRRYHSVGKFIGRAFEIGKQI